MKVFQGGTATIFYKTIFPFHSVMQSTSREASLPAAHNDDSFCWQQLPAIALSFYLSHYLYLSLTHGLHFSPYHITVFAPLIRTASFGSWLEWTSRFHSNGLLWVYRCVYACMCKWKETTHSNKDKWKVTKDYAEYCKKLLCGNRNKEIIFVYW